MSEIFNKAFDHVVGVEGKYSNDPRDSGGETMYGITAAVARSCGYQGAMKEMPLETAKTIYKSRYWDPLHLDQMPESIANELFDTGVNMGIGVAAQFLQRCLNALNRQQADYPDIPVDGSIGGKTLSALDKFLELRADKHGDHVLLVMLNCLQGAYYINLVEKREKDESFIFGWIKNRVVL